MLVLLGLNAKGSVRYGAKALLGYEFTCLAADTVCLVLNTYKCSLA